MEQNAGKPLTPEPRLSQVSPFVSLLTLPALVSLLVYFSSTVLHVHHSTVHQASQKLSKVMVTAGPADGCACRCPWMAT